MPEYTQTQTAYDLTVIPYTHSEGKEVKKKVNSPFFIVVPILKTSPIPIGFKR